MAKKKPIPKITHQNLKPPYPEYDYFVDAARHPFRHDSQRFELINAWWLAEISTLVYDAPAAVADLLKKRAGFTAVEAFGRGGTQCFVASSERFAVVAFRGTGSALRRDDPHLRHVLNNYRFVNNRDVVTNIPPSPPDKHLRGSLKYIARDGVIHDNPSFWERVKGVAELELLPFFNNLGLLRSGFAEQLPEGWRDHVPTLYATHIWNSYAADLERLGL